MGNTQNYDFNKKPRQIGVFYYLMIPKSLGSVAFM
jgi:hypothetical protein